MEGGSIMDYRVEQKKELVLYGCKRHFTGDPRNSDLQDHNFYCETRLKQAVLQYMAHDVDTTYNVFSDFSGDGYNCHIASYFSESEGLTDVAEQMGTEVADWFEKIVIPAGTYLICETEKCEYPTNQADELYRQAVTQWPPSCGYELAERPEVEIIHWPYKEGNEALNHSRYLELWLPIVKKESIK